MHDEPEQRAKDERRTAWLKAREIRGLRFTAEELELRPAVVLAEIVRAAAPSTG